jgi:hypothetical protein
MCEKNFSVLQMVKRAVIVNNNFKLYFYFQIRSGSDKFPSIFLLIVALMKCFSRDQSYSANGFYLLTLLKMGPENDNNRMPTIPTPIQHSTGIPSQSN